MPVVLSLFSNKKRDFCRNRSYSFSALQLLQSANPFDWGMRRVSGMVVPESQQKQMEKHQSMPGMWCSPGWGGSGLGDLAVHHLYINLQWDAKHCLSPVTFVVQAMSAAVTGWFGEVCALEGDPNLWVLSPRAQVSCGFSPPALLLAPTTNTG